jgi:hypothetical protein
LSNANHSLWFLTQSCQSIGEQISNPKPSHNGHSDAREADVAEPEWYEDEHFFVSKQ